MEAPPVNPDSYVLLDFRMLNWKYMNFAQKFRDETHIFTIKKLLAERHGRVGDMQICFNAFSGANEVKDDMLTLPCFPLESEDNARIVPFSKSITLFLSESRYAKRHK